MPSLIEMTENETIVDELINNISKRFRSPIGDSILSKLNYIIELTGKCTQLSLSGAEHDNKISKHNVS